MAKIGPIFSMILPATSTDVQPAVFLQLLPWTPKKSAPASVFFSSLKFDSVLFLIAVLIFLMRLHPAFVCICIALGLETKRVVGCAVFG